MNKKQHKYAINQVTQRESELKVKETTNIVATLHSKARATTLTGYKFTATISEKKVNCSQVSNGNKTGLYHESYYPSNIKTFLNPNPKDYKSELQHLKLTKYKGTNRQLVNFQVLPNSAHQVEFERYHGHIKIQYKYPFIIW